MAKRWLPALRGALAGVETKGLAERVRSQSTSYTVTGTPYAETWNVDRAVREGFRANPYVFRAVEVIASTAITRKIVMRQGDPDDGPTIDSARDHSRVLYRLNRTANKWESAKIFRYRLIAQLLLSSKGVFVEVSRSPYGTYRSLTLLDPDLVDMIPTEVDPIGLFRIRTTGDTGGRIDYLPLFDPADDRQLNSVLWIRSPHPTIMTQGMSPMEAAGLSVDLDRYARLYNRDYMQAGGRPGGILGVRGSVGPETVLALEQHFNHNARPGETTAIAADALYYQDLSTSPRDVQWGEIMDRMKGEASIVFGVPESMMGNASGRTFDNADAEYAIFLEHRFAPFVALIDDQLDALTGEDTDDLWLKHDLSDVWVLQRHRRADQDRAAADLDRGAITMNEYRDILGLAPINAPWANVHWIAPQKAAGYVDDPADGTAAAGLAILGQGPPPGGEAPPGQEPPAGGDAPALPAGGDDGGAGLRLIAAEGQGRSSDGGLGALPAGDAPAELELAHARPSDRELEGKESRGRNRATSTTWR